MNAEQYCTILNKYFEREYGEGKGWFVVTQSFTPGPTKFLRKFTMELIFHKVNGENILAHTIQVIDKIPYGKEDDFKEKQLQQLILDITTNPNIIDSYGIQV